MIRRLMVLALSASTLAAPRALAAQAASAGPAQDSSVVRRSLSGPRFGFTVFTGQVAELRSHGGLEPIMTQFGWQFERRLVSSQGGGEALLEWIFLVGGVEQGELNVTGSWLAGFRTASG